MLPHRRAMMMETALNQSGMPHSFGAFTEYGQNPRSASSTPRWVFETGGVHYLFSEVLTGDKWTIHRYASPDGGYSFGRKSAALLAFGEAGSYDEWGQADPTVMVEDGTWKMWHDARNASGNWVGLGYATSPDGATWTKHASSPVVSVGAPGAWDSDFIHHPVVVKDGATYYMVYCGDNGDGAYKIGLATSSDGVVWTKHGTTPIIAPGAYPQDANRVRPSRPLKIGNYWYMFYWGYSTATGKDTVMLAASPDLYHWTKYGAYFTGALTGGEADGIACNTPTYENGLIRLWYEGSTAHDTRYAWLKPNSNPGGTARSGWAWNGDNAVGYLTSGASRTLSANTLYGTKITVGAADIVVSKIKYYSYGIPNTQGKIKAAIYTYDSASAGTLVAGSESAEINDPVYYGWNTLNVPGTPTLTAGQSYWIVLWAEQQFNGLSQTTGAVTGMFKGSQTYAANFPANFSTASAMSFNAPGIYVVTNAASAGIYSISGVASDPGQVYEDGTALVEAENANLAAGQYYWDGADKLYVRCADSANPNVDKVIRTAA